MNAPVRWSSPALWCDDMGRGLVFPIMSRRLNDIRLCVYQIGPKAHVLLKNEHLELTLAVPNMREASGNVFLPFSGPCLTRRSVTNLPPSSLTRKNLWVYLGLLCTRYVSQLLAFQGQCFDY